MSYGPTIYYSDASNNTARCFDSRKDAIFDAVEFWYLNNVNRNYPESIKIQKWKRPVLDENFGCDVLNNFLNQLDLEYHCDGASMDITPKMKLAEKAFLDVIREEYQVSVLHPDGKPEDVFWDEVKSVCGDFVDDIPF